MTEAKTIDKSSSGDAATSTEPLRILIAGAGIGGLTAAIALRRHGHRVTVFEQSRLANEIGAAINIAPNCNGILRRLGIFLENHGAVNVKALSDCDSTPKQVSYVDRTTDEETYGHPYHLMHRAHLHKAIKDRALEEGAELRTASRVLDVRQDSVGATVVLDGGEEYSGDVVIGADGIHSQTRVHLDGASQIQPFGSGMSGFRFLVPTAALANDPLTAPFVETPGMLIRISAKADHQILVMYPCVNGTVMNCMYALPTSLSGVPNNTGGAWHNETSKAKMLATAEAVFAPAPLAVLQKANPNEVKLWELMDMERLPTWVTGRIAVLGDAAHPFTPWRGQGGAQAIEDAASLGVIFSLGTTRAQVPERLLLYEQCRRERAEAIQDASRKASPLYYGLIREGDERASLFTKEGADFLMGFDEWAHSERMLHATR